MREGLGPPYATAKRRVTLLLFRDEIRWHRNEDTEWTSHESRSSGVPAEWTALCPPEKARNPCRVIRRVRPTMPAERAEFLTRWAAAWRRFEELVRDPGCDVDEMRQTGLALLRMASQMDGDGDGESDSAESDAGTWGSRAGPGAGARRERALDGTAAVTTGPRGPTGLMGPGPTRRWAG